MSGFLASTVAMLFGRATGPLTLRLILQPTMATLLAIRAGVKDARTGRTPYLQALLSGSGGRGTLVREGWRQVRKIFFIALALDLVYQILVFRWIYPGQTLIVAFVLAVVPYFLVRGIATRLARIWARRPQDASR